jgi:mRNA-degrading endonuclease RelE of RelBE toxin-antitoxin system
MKDNNLLSVISEGLAEMRNDDVYHQTLKSALARLDDIWNPLLKPKPSLLAMPSVVPSRAAESPADSFGYEVPKPPRPKRPPPWYIGMSSSFTKAISKIDRKLQGRILEALTDITENPTTVRGDTVKPLSGELQGCWRYRLGDYRLVYSPDQSSGDITLLAFASRGSIYEE